MALTDYRDEIIHIPVPGDGPVPSAVMLVGERPGKEEPRAGIPFVGLAGKELDRFLSHGNINRRDIYITNLVKTYHNGDHPTPEEITRDLPILVDEIARVRPAIIVPMGSFAIHHFMGTGYTVDVVHGVPRFSHEFGCFLFPTYHPAAGFYDADTQPAITDDFYRLGKFIDGTLAIPNYGDRNQIGTITRSDNIPDVIGLTPSIDTEGSTDRPWCLTYCGVDGRAWLIKGGDKEILSRYGKMLDNCRVVYLHNSTHDLAVLRGLGIRIPEGKFIDTMVWAYLLCVEPQGLKQLAYRHLGMEMESYADITAQATWEKSIDYLYGVCGVEWPDPEPYVILKGGVPKVTKPQNLGRRVRSILTDIESDKRSKDGEPVDPVARWNKIEEHLRLPAELLLGELPEATLDDIPYEKAHQYACTDAIATNRIVPYLEREIRRMGLERVSEIDHDVLPIVDRMMEVGFPIGEQEVWDKLSDKCQTIMHKAQYNIKKLTGASINPDSGDQVAALIYGSDIGIPITKLTESKKRGRTDEKVLNTMLTLHPVVPLIQEFRKASKVRSSFALPIPVRSKNKRIHGRIKTTRVSSGRFSMADPNLMAIPVRSDLGKEVRNCFVAPEGRILSSHDLDQAEMRMMAHESEDPFMCEVLSDSRRDIHYETGALMFGIRANWQDKYSGVDKMRHRYPAKRVGFGVITGITEHGLKDQMDLAGATKNGKPIGQGGEPWTVSDCKGLITEWFNIYKGAKAYMDTKRDEAIRNGCVRDWVGRIRYLPGVLSPIRHIREEALRQSHSHAIQAGAQALLKIGMARVWEFLKQWRREGRYAEMLLQIHDELIHEWEDGDKVWLKGTDECIVACLCSAAELRVPIKAAGSYGYKWGELKD